MDLWLYAINSIWSVNLIGALLVRLWIQCFLSENHQSTLQYYSLIYFRIYGTSEASTDFTAQLILLALITEYFKYEIPKKMVQLLAYNYGVP